MSLPFGLFLVASATKARIAARAADRDMLQSGSVGAAVKSHLLKRVSIAIFSTRKGEPVWLGFKPHSHKLEPPR